MSQSLATVQYKPTELGTERLGAIMVKSGFFKDLREEAQAIVKMLYGAELGFGPIASVMGVYIVDGRPSLSAQLIASAVQRSGRFRYRVREWTAQACRIEFFENGESLGESSFTMAEATTAKLNGKAVWQQYPKAMLWARAMSQGARAFTPEIFNGAVYTPEELGAVVEVHGRLVDVESGEVIEEQAYVPPREREDIDDREIVPMVTSIDDPTYRQYAGLCERARAFQVQFEVPELPIPLADLKVKGTELASLIKAAKRDVAHA